MVGRFCALLNNQCYDFKACYFNIKILEHAQTEFDPQSLTQKCLTLGLGENSIWPGGKEPFAAGFQHNEWFRGEGCINVNFLWLDILVQGFRVK